MKSFNIVDIYSSANGSNTFREGTSLYTISLTTKSIMTSAYILAFIVSLLGNSMGLFIVIKRSRKTTCSTNIIIGNMTLADLLVTLFTMPNSVLFLYVQNTWFGGVLGELACKLFHFPSVVTISASVLTILTISVERYCAVFYYLKHSFLRRSKFITGIIWSFSIALASPYLFTLTVVQSKDGRNFCVVAWGDPSDLKYTFQSQRVYYSIIFVFLYAIPLIFMTVLYTLIARKLWTKTVTRDDSIVPRSAANQSKRKVVKLLIALVVVFALCTAPAHIMHYFMFYQPYAWSKIPMTLKMLSFYVNHCNSAINPIAYILLSEGFRREFFRLTSCERHPILSADTTKSRRAWKGKTTVTTRLGLQAVKKATRL